jgi:hypothetical protein
MPWSAIHSDAPPSREMFQQLWAVFRHQIQPWVPVLCQRDVDAIIDSYDPARPPEPLVLAIVAAASPYVPSIGDDHQRYFKALQETGTQKILQCGDMGHFRASLILEFLLFGKGAIDDFWGMVIHLPQLAQRAGLHLEDYHLLNEHREFRQMIKLDDGDQSWAGKETTRRLFWSLFLQDHFAAVVSGTRPNFDARAIRRLLPCDGQRWQDDQPVHTREFVPASVAIQGQVFADTCIGGLAYLIEATDIHSMVTAFICGMRDSQASKDVRVCLQEFLNLDLIMTSWKTRLPPRYQQASYDENGYMDHNVTLAHLTHNTSGIMLYQWSHAVSCMTTAGANLHPTLLSQTFLIKQAAKEISKICNRFLLHRHYLMSPQFSYCQFLAARALLAYANWMMEPVDEDYESLCSSLAESARRWDGVATGSKGDLDVTSRGNFASMLRSRLAMDAKKPDAIDLAASAIHLLREMEWTNLETEVTAEAPAEAELAAVTGTGAATGTTQTFMGSVDDFNRAMSLLVTTQRGSLDTRIFSWQDSPLS